MRDNQLSLPENFVSSLYLALYTSKKQSITIMKLCKLIPNRYNRRKDI